MMNKHFTTLCVILPLMLLLALPISGAPKREHRSNWCSAYVSDWPTSPITDGNVVGTKKICNDMLDSLQTNNFNAIYYHVRAMCDAMYNSQFEPWSKYVSGTRGVAPVFDPFGYLITEAHKRGIEVYAWVNPYRYSNNGATYGAGDLNYENSHPDWLLSNAAETILNPAMPEVEQRIVEVCKDIVTKYDVDGLVFDDYFYNNGGLEMSADASFYTKYTSAGGTLSQADWRRENVNTMVRKVNEMVKSVKPWVRFGVGPAGVAGTSATSASKYNVEPCPAGSDWQYNQIYSDPLAWLSEGTIDFISPQVYWAIGSGNDYQAIVTWWNYVANKFNRHAYISQTLSDFANKSIEDYVSEINVNRNTCLNDGTGIVYFQWKTLRYSAKTIDRKNVKLMNYLKSNIFQTKALEPLCNWCCGTDVTIPTNLRLSDGKTLNWNGDEGMRYVVYAVPNSVAKCDFTQQAEYIADITYTNSYEIKAGSTNDYWYAVSTYDRYGKESSAVTVGSVVGNAPFVTIVSPDDNIVVKGMTNFRWNSESTMFTFKLATDAAMKNVVYSLDTDNKYLLSTCIPNLEAGRTYYYQVISKAIDCRDCKSSIRSFSYQPLSITSPSPSAKDVELNPTIKWDEVDNATYELTLATDPTMSKVAYRFTTTDNSIYIPQYKLCSSTIYYAQVKAKVGEDSCLSEVISFTTIDHEIEVPSFVNPSEDGTTLYSDSKISFTPIEGINNIRIEISASSTFPPRSSYASNIKDFSFASANLGDVKIGSTLLKDGSTYYVRARSEYNQAGSGSKQYSDYAQYHSFVYNSGAGVEGVESADDAFISYEADPMLVITNLTTDLEVTVYATDGSMISYNNYVNKCNGRSEINLSFIPAGSHIILVKYNNKYSTLKLKR